jgi:hypothetical protein
MDHKDQHHQHHQKEREHEIHKRQEHERAAEKRPRSLHPAWYVVAGVVLALLALLVWTFIL